MSRPFVVFGYGSLIFKVTALFRDSYECATILPSSLHPMLFDKVTKFPNTLIHSNRKYISSTWIPKGIRTQVFTEIAWSSRNGRGLIGLVSLPRAILHSACLQNPGRVVTLIHKEDWDKFSQSVSPNSSPKFSHLIGFPWPRTLFQMTTLCGVPTKLSFSSSSSNIPFQVLHLLSIRRSKHKHANI